MNCDDNDDAICFQILGRLLLLGSPHLDETHLDAMRGLIKLTGFRPSASKCRARQSDTATSEKDKQICFLLIPRI